MTRITQAKIDAASKMGIFPIVLMGIGTIVLTVALTALSFGSVFDTGDVAVAAAPRQISLPLPLIIHLATVIPALPLGAYVLLRRKGDRLHKMLGRIWAALMLTTAICTFWVGEQFSFIHLFSVLTLVSIPYAVWCIRKGDVLGHRRALEGVYIGLVIAGAFTLIPGRLFWTLLFG